MNSDENISNALLSEYESTADNLQHGVNVTVETMQRYHGMTGKLLASALRSLWSQQELDEQIDKRVSARCATCDKAKDTVTWGWVVKSYGRTIIWSGAAVIMVAFATGNFDKLVDGVCRMGGHNVSSYSLPQR
jgi:hypothetical protein